MNKAYREEVESHFNEPILIWSELMRCIGYAEDDEDCYLIARDKKGNEVWTSLVGGYVYLTALSGSNAVQSNDDLDVTWDDLHRVNMFLGTPEEKEFIVKDQTSNVGYELALGEEYCRLKAENHKMRNALLEVEAFAQFEPVVGNKRWHFRSARGEAASDIIKIVKEALHGK